MDTFSEQRLRDEVIYLHSLWHQGPPRSNPFLNYNHSLSHQPSPISNPIPNFNHFPSHQTLPISNPVPSFNHFSSHQAPPISNPVPSFKRIPSHQAPPISNPIPNYNHFPSHQVLPISNPIPNFKPSQLHPVHPISNPIPNPNASFLRRLQLSNSTQFKQKKKSSKRRGKRGGRKQTKRTLGADPPPVSEIEWPCKPPIDTSGETSSGWPALNLKPALATRVSSEEEKVRFLANQLQQQALKVAQEFFTKNVDSDGDAIAEDDDDDVRDEDEGEEYKFFLKIFAEDSGLRGYYERNNMNGEFYCLVCGGTGKKVGKTFKNCVALVQHSVTIAKTKKRQAHRAYGQAICKILGWDINRLPSVLLSSSNPLGDNSAKLGDSQGNADDGCKEDSNVCNLVNVGNNVKSTDTNSCGNEVLPDKAVGLSNAVGGELMVCEHSLIATDGNKTTDDLEKGVSSMSERPGEGVVNYLEPKTEDGTGSCGNEVKDDQSDNVSVDARRKG